MGLNIAQLRAETLSHLGVSALDYDPDASTTNIDLLLNRSWWEIIDRYDFKQKEDIKTFQTIVGQRNYILNTMISPNLLEAINVISIIDLQDGSHKNLDVINENWYEDNYNDQITQQTQPTNYFHNNEYIYLYPTPDQIYTINIWHKFILTDVSASDPTIPQIWHEQIVYGAAYRGLLKMRDYTAANTIRSYQLSLIQSISSTDAKEDRLNKMSGVQVYGRQY